MAKHRKGYQHSREAGTRVIWNSIRPDYNKGRDGRVYTSPWVFFKNQTAMKKWQKDMRKLHPTIKFDDYVYIWSVEMLTSSLESKAEEYANS